MAVALVFIILVRPPGQRPADEDIVKGQYTGVEIKLFVKGHMTSLEEQITDRKQDKQAYLDIGTE